MNTISVILAAGRGSRMKGYAGNKTLLPLIPEQGPYEGKMPILFHILAHLPPGPRAIVVHHAKEDIVAATRGLSLVYVDQPELNGTGGALLAATEFVKTRAADSILITMGDVPFVRPETYLSMIQRLQDHALVVLGFTPESRRQYGVLETADDQVIRIIEWKYWSAYPEERKRELCICNSGIYAIRREALVRHLPVLASRPHVVQKEVHGRLKNIQEYFITDLVETMHEDRLSVGYIMVEDEEEVMGVDDLQALQRAQKRYQRSAGRREDGPCSA